MAYIPTAEARGFTPGLIKAILKAGKRGVISESGFAGLKTCSLYVDGELLYNDCRQGVHDSIK